MFKQIAGEIMGEEIYYCQVTDEKDRKEYNVPENVIFWWENKKGERIYSPHQMIMKVLDAMKREDFDIKKFIESPAVKEMRHAVVEEQKAKVIEALRGVASEYEKKGMKEVVNIIEKNIEDYNKINVTINSYGIAEQSGSTI